MNLIANECQYMKATRLFVFVWMMPYFVPGFLFTLSDYSPSHFNFFAFLKKFFFFFKATNFTVPFWNFPMGHLVHFSQERQLKQSAAWFD